MTEEGPALAQPSQLLTAGNLSLDVVSCTARNRNLVVRLGKLECLVLAALIRAGGRPVNVTELLNGIWGRATSRDLSKARSVIRRLRSKLQDRQIIETIGYEGYRLNA